MTVTDTVPANTVYDLACTNANLPSGVTAAYNLTTRTVTFTYIDTFVVSPTLPQNLPTVTMCTDILSTVNPGSQISNAASVVSNEAPASVRSNTAAITVGGAGRLALSKSVDKQVIRAGDTYNWTLTWNNTTSVSFAGPGIIDVLPYNNDGSSGASSQRNSGSSTFAGTNVLTGGLGQPTYAAGSTTTGNAPGTWYYTTASSTSIQQNPQDPTNQNPGTGASIWVPASSITDWSQVTGVFFQQTGFINGGDTIKAIVPMQANPGTELGDIYVNQAELWTSSAPDNPIVSNNPYTQIPGITIVKTANPTTVHRVNDTVTYTFVVSNQGKVSLAGVAVADTQAAPSTAASLGPITCQSLSSPAATCSGTTVPSLAPGQSATFTATYTVSQADADNGKITDTAVANALTLPGNVPVTSQPSTAVVNVPPAPGITVVKAANPTTVHATGDTVTYTFTATNSGNVTLSGVGIADVQLSPSLASSLSAITCASLASPAGTCSGGTTTLLPGQSATFTATYVVSQADVNNGKITDTATAHGTPPGTTTAIVSDPSTAVVNVPAAAGITVVKSANPTTVHAAGDTVTYSFVATNTGNVTLSGVGIADVQASPSLASSLGAITCASLASPAGTCSGGTTTLVPGQSATFTATYVVSQADVDNGKITDTATAHGTPPGTTTAIVSDRVDRCGECACCCGDHGGEVGEPV